MRKFTGLLAGLIALAVAGSALAGQPATDPQGDFIDLSLAATPPISGTAHAPRGVGLTFNSFSGNRINANDTVNNSGLTVVLHNNFTDNGLLFPACTINPKALSVCPKASQIGSGTAEGELLSSAGGAPTYVPATVAVYNGKPVSGKTPTLIFIASVNGTPSEELDFTVARVGGTLVFTELISSTPSSGPVIYLTKFTVTVPKRSETRKVAGKRSSVYLIDAPTSCHGAWTYSQTLTFPTRAPLTATDVQPCVKG